MLLVTPAEGAFAGAGTFVKAGTFVEAGNKAARFRSDPFVPGGAESKSKKDPSAASKLNEPRTMKKNIKPGSNKHRQ
jgi:hypothetical protein